jgi:hypothetical protein
MGARSSKLRSVLATRHPEVQELPDVVVSELAPIVVEPVVEGELLVEGGVAAVVGLDEPA